MNLNEQQKKIGKENFAEAVGISRRDFLAGVTASVAAGVGLGSLYFGYGKITSDPLRVGVIGTGDEGSVLIGAINPDYIQVVAIADIRPYNQFRAFHGDASSPSAAKARRGLMATYGWQTEDTARRNVKVYEAYEELLADPNVEAVIIALPLHLHSVASVKAMRAGKHVLTEKLMGHSVRECKEMGRVSRETGKILATGHQRHYSILYDNAVHTIGTARLIGDVHSIRAQWHRGNLPGKDSWKPLMPGDAKLGEQLAALQKELAAAKSSTDIDALRKRVAQTENQLLDASVDASKYGYTAMTLPDGSTRTPLEELIRWRLWQRTGGGLMAELGSHQLDAAGIFVSATHGKGKKIKPLTVMAMGNRSLFPADREIDDHVYCMYEYPAPGYLDEAGNIADPNKKIVVTYSSINGNGFGDYGEVVMGTSGTLILEKEQDVMLYKGAERDTRVTVAKGKGGPTLDTTESGAGPALAAAAGGGDGPPSRGYTEEMEHWAWCIRNPAPENQPRCKPEVALADAVIALVSNIALANPATQSRIEFKEEWFDIASDETPEGAKPDPTRDFYSA